MEDKCPRCNDLWIIHDCPILLKQTVLRIKHTLDSMYESLPKDSGECARMAALLQEVESIVFAFPSKGKDRR